MMESSLPVRPTFIPPNRNVATQTLANPLTSTSTSIKPSSRARTYRIPNTTETDYAGESYNHVKNGVNPNSESFLWATREIAALDFLMNIPLSAEREIVRAGLTGERWHQHRDQHHLQNNKRNTFNNGGDIELGISGSIDEYRESTYRISSQPLEMSNLSLTRSSGLEDETSTVTLSTMHSASEKGGSGNAEHIAATAVPLGGMRWWDKLILKDKRFFSVATLQALRREQLEMEERDLEGPSEYVNNESLNSEISLSKKNVASTVNPMSTAMRSSNNSVQGIPGRRLDGRDAISVAIPAEFRTRPIQIRAVARQIAVREWERKLAWHGVGVDGKKASHQHPTNNDSNKSNQALLDGRVFFSSKRSYPIAVFSVIKYEPQKEEAARRRKKLEELGGGGTQFVLPQRDWRGISYRSLLPQRVEQNTAFNRLLTNSSLPSRSIEKSPTKGASSDEEYDSDNRDATTISSDESDDYVPGFLDDPNMIQGRHRNVMIGDKITGPIVSSTIQFVKPSVLKNELNKQFRERFDRWEPPKSQRKFIGAKVIDGVYTLMDPTETSQEVGDNIQRSESLGKLESIRMPPSLKLSKIRSLKQQALIACVRSQIELSTLALACVYFERLCLSCRVDKSNRRLSFAACIFLAAKINESNTVIAFDGAETKSWVKPSNKSGKIFESMIVFFTHDWSISLKQLYAAEWIVFTALGFSLKATPSQVAFHFKRLLKVLEWDARSYLGNEMYSQWQDSLLEESRRRERRKARREMRMKMNERKLLKLQRKLHLHQSEGLHQRVLTPSESYRQQPIRSICTLDSTTPGSPREGKVSTPASVHQATFKAEESPSASKRGILSRLARPKNDNQVKEFDRLPKQDKKLRSSVKHSSSVPNLRALESKNHAITDSVISEHSGECECPPSSNSKDDADI